MTRSSFKRLAVMLGALALLAGLLPMGAALAATVNVNVGSNFYNPQNLGNISAGDTITWTWTAGTHDVTSANIPAGATAFQSPLLTSSNTTFSRTFTVAGNYRYYCSLHASASQANATPQSTTAQVGQFTVVADTTAPSAPSGLTATAAGASQIDLAWTPSSSGDVARQELFRNTVNTKPATPVQTFNNNTTASHADSGLTAGTPYYYWLDAIDGANNRSPSATASATTSSVAAQDTAQQAVLFDVAATLQLSVTPASIDFGSVSPAAASTTAAGATIANLKSNGGWTLSVKSIGTNGIDESPGDDAVFTSGLKTVPVGRMGWRVNPDASTAGSAAYTSLSDANSTIASAAAGTPEVGADTYLQYQLQTLYSDPVGLDYQTVLLFTATSP